VDHGTDVRDITIPDIPNIEIDTGFDSGEQPDTDMDVFDEGGIDYGPLDIPPDETPPAVASSDPAHESINVPVPFRVHVTFTEAIRDGTLDMNTFKVLDMNEQVLEGTLEYDAETFTATFTPAPMTRYMRGSPYSVRMTSTIQDRAGNRLEPTTIYFSTALYPNQEAYSVIAAKYSPIINQSVNAQAPQFDYPTSFTLDGDFNAVNNDEAIKFATEIPAVLYYDVVETKSHYFLRYAYFYPRHTESIGNFGNEVVGAMVVVRKYPTEMPIAAETYFTVGSKEDLRSFVTTESGIVTDRNGKGLNDTNNRTYYLVNWVFPQAELFPAGHFHSYVSTGTHESCAWAQTNKEATMDFRCQLSEGLKTSLKFVRFAYIDGTEQLITRGAGGFPTTTPQGQFISLGLRSMMEEWWSRRNRLGINQIFESFFQYEALSGRGGNGLVAPQSFKNTTSDARSGGRPPWAWNWNPTFGDFEVFNRGTFFYDPAYYFAKRHKITLTPGKSDFSDTYCFNPYLLLDNRADPDCGGGN
jgi:hypothetical protein